MCSGPEQSKSSSTPSPSSNDMASKNNDVEEKDSFSGFLELASNNDVEGFKKLTENDGSVINEEGLWYCRQSGSKQVVLMYRTPLMVAALYGCIDIMKLMLSYPVTDVNLVSATDKSTALHCAASGGSSNVTEVVELLLSAGANPDLMDSNGNRPIDVSVVPPKLHGVRFTLEKLLACNTSSDDSVSKCALRVSIDSSNSSSETMPSCQESGWPSPSESVSSPLSMKYNESPAISASGKKEYPIDPSIPDIKNSMYATDEFRMFQFKVRPCSRAYSHDWTECPFVHPGENARRRDPRKFHYSCVPCPDFRKGACRRGDMCEYAHGVFECWLHPAQYRTRLCKDGTSCNRRVCFFAHTAEELRPLYVSTGAALPSPRSSSSAANVMDMAAAMSVFPSSPSSLSVMRNSPFTQSMSPSANVGLPSSMAWPQANVPTLQLPGSNLQSSRLRSSLNARDVLLEEFDLLADFDGKQQLLNESACFSQSPRNSALARSSHSKMLTPSNLEELFSAELSSPRFSEQAIFSPTQKSSVLPQFQQQQSGMLSPINTRDSADHSLLQASFGVASPGRMSPRSLEPLSPAGSRLSPFGQREKQQQFRSLSSRDLGSRAPPSVIGSPVNSLSGWSSSNRNLDWPIIANEVGQFCKSSLLEDDNSMEEPDLSWVQSLVKDSSPEVLKHNKTAVPASGTAVSAGLKPDSQVEAIDQSVVATWVEQMQLDPLVA